MISPILIPVLKTDDFSFRASFDPNYNVLVHDVSGGLIEKTRKALKIKQKKLANMLNISAAYVGQVERGLKRPTRKFHLYCSILLDLDILHLASLGIQNIIKNFPTSLLFNLQIPAISGNSLSPSDLTDWINKTYISIINSLSQGELPPNLNNFPRQSLYYLSLFAPDILSHPFYSSLSFRFNSRQEQESICVSLHIDNNGIWSIEYSSYIAFRISGKLSDFMLLSLASKMNTYDTSRPISISINDSALRFKYCEFFHIEVQIIYNLISKFLNSKNINIPITSSQDFAIA